MTTKESIVYYGKNTSYFATSISDFAATDENGKFLITNFDSEFVKYFSRPSGTCGGQYDELLTQQSRNLIVKLRNEKILELQKQQLEQEQLKQQEEKRIREEKLKQQQHQRQEEKRIQEEKLKQQQHQRQEFLKRQEEKRKQEKLKQQELLKQHPVKQREFVSISIQKNISITIEKISDNDFCLTLSIISLNMLLGYFNGNEKMTIYSDAFLIRDKIYHMQATGPTNRIANPDDYDGNTVASIFNKFKK